MKKGNIFFIKSFIFTLLLIYIFCTIGCADSNPLAPKDESKTIELFSIQGKLLDAKDELVSEKSKITVIFTNYKTKKEYSCDCSGQSGYILEKTLPEGFYEIKATDKSDIYDDYRKVENITSDQTLDIIMPLKGEKDVKTFTIKASITDNKGDLIDSNTKLKITLTELLSNATKEVELNGKNAFVIPDISEGYYEIKIEDKSANKLYNTYISNQQISSDLSLSVKLINLQTGNKYTVRGNISDDRGGLIDSNAKLKVTLTEISSNIVKEQNLNGKTAFVLSDVYEGYYEIKIEDTNANKLYNTYISNQQIGSDLSLSIVLTSVETEKRYIVKGNITDENGGLIDVNAKLKITLTDISTNTVKENNLNGKTAFVLSDISEGYYEIKIEDTNAVKLYNTYISNQQINSDLTLSIKLSISQSEKKYTLKGNFTDDENGLIDANAKLKVTLTEVSSDSVKEKNLNGKTAFVLSDISEGYYEIKIEDTNAVKLYNTYITYQQINSDLSLSIKLTNSQSEEKLNVMKGSITSTEGDYITDSDIVVKLTNISDESITFTFNCNKKSAYYIKDIPSGFYEIKIYDDNTNSPSYKTNYIYQEISNDLDLDLSLISLEKEAVLVNFKGEVSDALGNPLGFTTITATGDNKTITTTTNISNGEFCLAGLSSGTYTVTFSKPPFTDFVQQLIITDDKISFGNVIYNKSEFSTALEHNYQNWMGQEYDVYDLKKVIMPLPNNSAGAIAGTLKNYCGPNAEFVLYQYDSSIQNKPILVGNYITNSRSEFIISGLSANSYIAVAVGALITEDHTDPNQVLYKFNANDIYFDVTVSENQLVDIKQ